MDDPFYRFLKYTAIVLTIGWVAWSAYDGFFKDVSPGDDDYFAANKLFEDGEYQRALEKYDDALSNAPEHIHSLRGKALTLMQLENYDSALLAFNSAIEKDPQFAGSYANRGILLDRMGRYEDALEDYQKALAMDPELADGPGWLTRFLRLQPDKPPTIADRALYLKEQLEKPESERVLRMPEIDEKQRPYKK